MSLIADSMIEDDKTLPVDFDGSCNPNQLPEVTFGPQLEAESTPPVVEKGNGRMSPVHAHTMKEHEQQLSDLKKENFNLKLRIYFLEEKVQQKFDGEGEDLFRTNIELKVKIESLKRDLADKQDLLKKASAALETISHQHSAEVQQVEEFTRQAVLKDAEKQRKDTEQEIQELRDQLVLRDEELVARQQCVEDTQKRVDGLISSQKQLEAALKASETRRRHLESKLDSWDDTDHSQPTDKETKSNNDLQEKDRLIEQLKNALKAKELIIEQQEEEWKDEVKCVRRPLEANITQLQRDIERRDKEIQTLQSRLAKKGLSTSTMSEEEGDSERDDTSCEPKKPEDLTLSKEKDAMIGKLEDIIHERDQEIENLSSLRKELEKKNKSHEKNALTRDKAIQGLTKACMKRDEEIQSLSSLLETKDSDLRGIRDQLHDNQMDKYDGVEKHQNEVASRDDQIADLKALLRENQLERQRLEKNVQRQDAEVERLNKQLEKSDNMAHQREDALQELREYLQREKDANTHRASALESHYKALLDDQQRRIDSQEKMLQRLTRSLQDKDTQLQDMLDAQGIVGVKDSRDRLVESLKAQLAEKDSALEEAIAEKYHALEERDNEARQHKVALRERHQDLEKANQMLLNTEEAIDSLTNESKEKDITMRQLATALKAQQRELEATSESHERAMTEKDSLIDKLHQTLQQKDKNIEDVFQASGSDDIIQGLQQQLQDVLSGSAKAAEAHEQGTRQLLLKLKERDNEVKDIEHQYQEELSQLQRQKHTLQADLNKKDYELQTLDGKATWAEEQQQELLDKLRAALNEKDKTIEALVESGRQKDRLFHRMTSESADPQPFQTTSSLAEMQKLKDQVAYLTNELQNKESVNERLKAAVERHSPKPDMVPRSRLHDVEDELEETSQAALKKKLAAAERCQRCDVLQDEVDRLHQEADRSPAPIRTQTLGGNAKSQVTDDEEVQLSEIRRLADTLKTRHEIQVNVNSAAAQNTESSRSLEIELQAVQALRKQLEEGLQRNKSIRNALEAKLRDRDSATQADSGVDKVTLEQKVTSLQTELEESRRWNSSLLERLQQQQPISGIRDTGVGGALSQGTSNLGEETSVERQRQRHRTDSPLGGTTTLDHDVTPTGPSWGMTGAATWGVSSTASSVGDSTLLNSFLPSFYGLPGLEELPNEDSLCKMSAAELQMLVRDLRSQLQSLHSESFKRSHNGGKPDSHLQYMWTPKKELQRINQELETAIKQRDELQIELRAKEKNMPSDMNGHALQQQLSAAQKALSQKENELEALKLSVGPQQKQSTSQQSNGQNVENLESQISQLTAQLKHAENLNSLLKRQIELNSQSDATPAGFNPQVIVELTREIQKLKAEANTKINGSSEGKGADGQKSRIPQLSTNVDSSVSSLKVLQKQIEGLRGELSDAKAQNTDLQSTLSSTEATVRGQADKMKHYRSLLDEAGLLPKSPTRSHSESNLNRLGINGSRSPIAVRNASSGEINQTGGTQLSLLNSGNLRDIDLDRLAHFGGSDNISELKDQVSELQTSLLKYDKVVGSLNSRSRSTSGDSGKFVSHIPVLTSRLRSTGGSTTESLSAVPSSAAELEVGQLKQEIEDLQNQLVAMERNNKALQAELDKLKDKPIANEMRHEGVGGDSSAKASKQQTEALVKQMASGKKLCVDLRKRLSGISQEVGQLLQQDKHGNLSAITVKPGAVATVKDGIQKAQDMASELSKCLSTQEGSTSGHASGSRTPPVDSDLYRQAQETISWLKDQLEQHSKDQVAVAPTGSANLQVENRRLQEKISAQNQTLDRLKSEREELLSKINSLETRVEQMQNELFEGQERFTQVEQEKEKQQQHTNKLQQQLSEGKSAQSQLTSVEEQLRTAQTQLKSSQQELSAAQQQLDEAQKLNKKQENFLANSHQQIQSLEKTKQQNLTEKKRLQNCLVAQSRDCDTLQRKVHGLQQEVNKLTGEGAEKDQSLASLRERLDLLQRRAASGDQLKGSGSKSSMIHHNGEASSMAQVHSISESTRGNESMESVERQRHPTAGSDYNRPADSMLSHFDESTASHNIHTQPSQKDNHSPDSIDFSKYITESNPSSEEALNPNLQTHDISRITDFSEKHETLNFPRTSLFKTPPKASRPSRSMHEGPEEELDPVVQLQSQIDMAEELNCTMQEICDKVHLHETSLSVGIQNSPPTGSQSSQTQDSGHPGESQEALQGLDLAAHLEELRALRKKLEESIAKNDHLRQIMEKKMTEMNAQHGETYNITVVEKLQSEINLLDEQLHTRNRQLNNINSEMERLRSELQQKSQDLVAKDRELVTKDNDCVAMALKVKEVIHQNTLLQSQIEDQDKVIKKFNKNMNKMEEELNGLREQLAENSDLNKTLKLELSMYDKMASTSPGGSKMVLNTGQLDLGLLLEEIRQLRVQLERTIENNNQLRHKLEEQLSRSPSSQCTHINIHKQRSTDIHFRENGNMLNGSNQPSSWPQDKQNDPSLNSRDRHHSDLDLHLRNRHSSDLHLPPRDRHHSDLDLKSRSSGAGVMDDILRYNITDPHRPPSLTLSPPYLADPASPPTHDTQPSQAKTTDNTSLRVSPDLRCLYAIGAIDDYELLKKQVAECSSVIVTLDSMLKVKSSTSNLQTVEGGMLRRMLSCMNDLQSVVGEQKRLIGLFWMSQLPQKDHSGDFVDIAMVKQNQELQNQLAELQTKYRYANTMGRKVVEQLEDAQRQLEQANQHKTSMEKEVIRTLSKTSVVLTKAKENLLLRCHDDRPL